LIQIATKETGITKIGAFQALPHFDTVKGYVINHFHNAFEVKFDYYYFPVCHTKIINREPLFARQPRK